MKASGCSRLATGGARLIRLTGELHSATLPNARRRIWPEMERSAELIVDLEGVSFLDSAGLGFLLAVNREVTRRGRRWALVGVSAPVARLLALTQADRLLPLFLSLADVEQAWREADARCPGDRDEEPRDPREPARAGGRLTG